jgi:predicted nucleic acid-binding protein
VLTVDANVLIALMDPKDATHVLAVEMLDSYEWDELATSTVTLAEVLVRPMQDGVYEERLDAVSALGVHLIGVDGERVRTTAQLSARHRLRPPDAVVLAVAMSTSSAIMTLDVRLAKVARRLGFPVIDRPDDDPAVPDGVDPDTAALFSGNATAWWEWIPPGR